MVGGFYKVSVGVKAVNEVEALDKLVLALDNFGVIYQSPRSSSIVEKVVKK